MGHMKQDTSSPWFPGTRRRPDAPIQIFFFPFAGGGASAYTRWHDYLPDMIEPWPLEYPGHESRFRESLAPSLVDLARLISAQIATVVRGRFALFGHSMGSALAYETSRSLKKDHGLEPEMLFVSGYSAPHLSAFRPPVRDLPEFEFRQEIKRYGGTPPEILADEDFMQFISPLLRHDLGLCETHQHEADVPLNIPVVAFGGYDDPTVPWNRLLEWSRLTSSAFVAHFFPGEHFFIKDAAPRVAQLVAHALASGDNSGDLLPPASDMVHLWAARTDIPATDIEQLSDLLSEDERDRARKFVRPCDRSRSVVGRAALRDLLGQYKKQPAEALSFTTSSTEKPLCDEAKPLEFNVSHSGSLALLGFAQGQAIGVDVEEIRSGVYEQGLARQVMTTAECRLLDAHRAGDREPAFFDLWVRKEAVLKRSGEGFTGSARAIDTGFSSPYRTSADLSGTSRRDICSFTLADGHAGAVAAERPIAHVVVRYWQPVRKG
jgi:medium-chain acyl-[acyl-carrier-protein] hydrolase